MLCAVCCVLCAVCCVLCDMWYVVRCRLPSSAFCRAAEGTSEALAYLTSLPRRASLSLVTLLAAWADGDAVPVSAGAHPAGNEARVQELDAPAVV